MRKINFGAGLRRISAFAAILMTCLLATMFLWQRLNPVRGQAQASLQVSSASFSDGGAIPGRYTCDGADVSPALRWSNPPAATKSFAILMSDPDFTFDFTHWIAYNIPSGVQELAEGASTQGAMPQDSAEGTNDFPRFGYAGPCPPPGKPHHYVFQIYALDGRLKLPPGVTRKQFDAAIGGHELAVGRLVGIYQRAKP